MIDSNTQGTRLKITKMALFSERKGLGGGMKGEDFYKALCGVKGRRGKDGKQIPCVHRQPT
jgi:hypothetical protein